MMLMVLFVSPLVHPSLSMVGQDLFSVPEIDHRLS